MSVLSVPAAGSGSAPHTSGDFCPWGSVSASGHVSQAGEVENNLSKAAVPQFSAHWTIAALRRARGWLGQQQEAGFNAEVGSASDLFTTGWSWGLFPGRDGDVRGLPQGATSGCFFSLV